MSLIGGTKRARRIRVCDAKWDRLAHMGIEDIQIQFLTDTSDEAMRTFSSNRERASALISWAFFRCNKLSSEYTGKLLQQSILVQLCDLKTENPEDSKNASELAKFLDSLPSLPK